ncbi:Nitric oxide-dependent regulator DnrN or NorA [Fulvivirga imtechensis AK7]|uniref:Nitric oxide-dependent regulator DnrN or NorA n=1 Tax=Fulvivirga imtechensis AK7 TaxID=1237149 RepID=L8JTF1_9BACT|nr:iron-sulfur cluster repair di-iron protein [Fulvivirga imtechensis]ELR70769.1 Nitric oxide-dependent regulator DnrN or NorA [Fulvivirga imtechensis AK7]
MEHLKDKKVGRLVAEDYRYADVFKKYGIDFCCGGGVSIEEACRKKKLDCNNIIDELNRVIVNKDHDQDFDSWSPDRLADYIIEIHHAYVKEHLPLLVQYSYKVSRVHGGAHPETIEVNRQIHELASELLPHLQKEEVVLFPYIKKLVAAARGGVDLVPASFGSLENPVKMMMEEHDNAGEIMRSISELSSGYTPPASACTTYRVLYQKLRDFENDLHRHIHLENNILFPKVIEMEKQEGV